MQRRGDEHDAEHRCADHDGDVKCRAAQDQRRLEHDEQEHEIDRAAQPRGAANAEVVQEVEPELLRLRAFVAAIAPAALEGGGAGLIWFQLRGMGEG